MFPKIDKNAIESLNGRDYPIWNIVLFEKEKLWLCRSDSQRFSVNSL